MIVMKFGGTSVQDAKAIERAGAIVQGQPTAQARTDLDRATATLLKRYGVS